MPDVSLIEITADMNSTPSGTQAPRPNAAPRRAAVPRLPHPFVPRQRLVDALIATAHAPVRVVHAPAGYGKSTLLAEWARQTDETVVWFSTDTDGEDDKAFVPRLRALLDEVCPDDGDRTSSSGADEDNRASIESRMRRLARVGEHVTLVIERFDRLDPALGAELLRRVNVTEHASLVIESRGPVSRTGAAYDNVDPVVTATDLAFLPAETVRLAHDLLPAWDDKAAEALHQDTRGWPHATRLALSGAAANAGTDWYDTYDSVADVARTLFGDLQAHAAFAFLITAAVPETVTADEAVAMGAAPSQASILEEAERRGLGWWDGQGDGRRFRFHPMIRHALLSRLDTAERRRAERALAEWLAARGRYHDAFPVAVRAHSWDLARDFAHASLVDVGLAPNENRSLMAAVPKSVIRADPMMALLYALSHYMEGHMTRALGAFASILATAERRSLLKGGVLDADHVWIQGILTIGLRLSGRYELVEPALRRFKNMVSIVTASTDALDASEDLFLTEAAVTELYLGRLDDARETLATRPRRGPRTKGRHVYGDALDALILVMQGHVDRARDAQDALRSAPTPPRFDGSFHAIPLHLAAAYLHLEDGRPDLAAQEMPPTEQHWRTTENWPLLLAAHTEIAWRRSDAVGGLQTLELRQDDQLRRADISPAMKTLLIVQRVELLVAAGRAKDARRLLPRRTSSPSLAMARAVVLLAEGQRPQASALIEQTMALSRMTPRERLDLHLLAAFAASRLKDGTTARRQFGHAVDLAVRTGLRSPFDRMPRDMLLEMSEAVDIPDDLHERVRTRPSLYTEATEPPRLTRMERAALDDLNRGASVAETAKERSVSVNTVKTQRRSLYKKLEAGSAAEALAKARDLGMI